MLNKIFLLMLGVVFCFLQVTPSLSALSPEQKKLYQKGIYYYDLPGCSSAPVQEEDVEVSNSIYMLGDSISVGAKNDLEKEFKSKNYKSYINASVSRSITSPGSTPGLKTTGLEAVDDDKGRIKKASQVIIALGTNQNNDFEGSIKKLVDKVRGHNKDAKIYWVNIFSKGGSDGYDKIDQRKINKSIEKMGASQNFTVINTADKNIELSDSVHPKAPEGTKKFAETVVAGIGNSSEASPATSDAPPVGKDCSCGSESSGDANLTGSTREEQIFNYFVGQGLKPFQAAGIMGNMKAESGLNPRSLEPGTTGDSPIAGRGYGLVQWTFPARQDPLIEKARKANKKVYDLGVQLEYVMDELKGSHKTAGENLKKTKNVTEATLVIELQYEIHAGGVQPERTQSAKDFLAKYGSGSGGGGSDDATTCTTNDGGSGEVTGEYSLPVPKKWYDSNPEWFSKPHHDYPASDIPVPEGTKVFAVTAGKVVAGGANGECGNGVIIRTNNNVEYVYCHGSDGSTVSGAKPGDTVKAGDLIMHSDNTGTSTGTHLHLQIKVRGEARCPQKLFKAIADGKPISESSLPKGGCISG